MLELDTEQAAAVLGFSPETLKKWRRHDVGGGPVYHVKKGRRVVYRYSDLWDWMKNNIYERGGHA